MINIEKVNVGDMGVNCYIVTDRETGKTAVVDPGGMSRKFEMVLEDVGYDNIEYILLTHCHFDHIGGVERLRANGAGRAKVVLHEAEKDMITDPHRNLSQPMTGRDIRNVVPDILVKDGDKLPLGSSTITVMHTPGHTPGCVCYIIDDSIFSGDTLFYRSAGRTDFSGGSISDMKKSLLKLAALDGDFDVYPGHDLKTKLSDERAKNPYICH